MRRSGIKAHIAGILRTLPVGIVTLSLDGTQTSANDSMCRLTGFRREDLEGIQPPFPYWDPDGLEAIEAAFRQTLAGGAAGQSFELPFHRKDGEKFIARVDASDFTDARGQRIAIAVTVQDITQRKRTEEWLRAAEDRYRGTLDNMVEGCQIIGFDWRFLYVNDAVTRQGHPPKEEMVGRPMTDLYPGFEKTKVFGALRRCMEQRTSRILEKQSTLPDGTKHWFELRVQPVPEGICILSQDVTERKQAEIELRRHNSELGSLLKASRAITGSVNVEQVIDAIMESVREVIPTAEAQAIALYDEKEGVLKTRYASGLTQDPALQLVIRPGEGITGKAFHAGRARLYTTSQEIADDQVDLRADNLELYLQATGGRRPVSSVAIPLESQRGTIGTMVLSSFGQRMLTDRDLALAQNFASIAATAIDNAALHADLAALLEVSQAVASSLDIDQVMASIMENTRRVIPTAEAQAIALYDEKEGMLKTRFSMGYQQSSRQLAIRPGESFTGKTFLSGQARLYATPEEVAEEQDLSPENMVLFLQSTGNRHARSVISLPLKSGDSVMGCMVLHNFGEYSFTAHDMELAEALANSASMALRNAALDEETRRHNAELASLLEASQAVTSSLDLDEVLASIMQKVKRVIGAADYVAVLLYDKTEGVLKSRIRTKPGSGPSSSQQLRLTPGEGITGKAFLSGEATLYPTPEAVAEARKDLAPDTAGQFLALTGGRIPSSSLAVPLRVQATVLGVMVFHSFGEKRLSDHDLDLALAFANTVAIAIANASLHEDMTHRALTDGLTGLYNRGHFYERLGEEIARHRREGRSLCVAIMDMDNLKIYNDTYGHLAGDALLEAIGKALRAAIRRSDIAFRYGGDEFSVILTNTTTEVARDVMDRVKRHVVDQVLALGIPGAPSVSFSTGVAGLAPGQRMDEQRLTEAADRALYQAKVGGGTVVWTRGGGG